MLCLSERHTDLGTLSLRPVLTVGRKRKRKRAIHLWPITGAHSDRHVFALQRFERKHLAFSFKTRSTENNIENKIEELFNSRLLIEQPSYQVIDIENLTKREKFICDQIKFKIREKGLFFTGIDVIDGYLTEINVTSPTCIREVDTLNKVNISYIYWEEALQLRNHRTDIFSS